jgi:hypothetical protein
LVADIGSILWELVLYYSIMTKRLWPGDRKTVGYQSGQMPAGDIVELATNTRVVWFLSSLLVSLLLIYSPLSLATAILGGLFVHQHHQ